MCEEAKCPNIGECWGGEKGTATATIMVSMLGVYYRGLSDVSNVTVPQTGMIIRTT